MSINEFFDFAAASGEYSETEPSSTAQTWATSSSPFNEELHNFPTPNNNHGVPSYSSFQADNNLAGNTAAWAEMEPGLHQHQSISNMAAATSSLPEETNVWAHDSSISPTKPFQLDSSAPTETQDHLHCGPLTPTALASSQWRMDDQQFQGSSVMDAALPSEGNQSEEPDFRRALGNLASAHPRRMIRCPWPSCVVNLPFQDEVEASVHFESHRDAMLESWDGPTKCSWPNCSSILFKEKYLLHRHLRNIHVTPLRCSVVGCSRLQPFGKESDLKRHVKEIHEALRILCPVESCESNSIGFARKYNLDKHMREEHDNVRCSLNHCGASILDGEQESHIKYAHDDYECALGACEVGSRSCFTMEAGRLHLISAHKMDKSTAYRPFYSSQKNRLIDRKAFRGFHLIKKFEDCQACLDSLPGAK